MPASQKLAPASNKPQHARHLRVLLTHGCDHSGCVALQVGAIGMHEIREVLRALEEQGFFPPADPKWAAFKSHSSSVAQKLRHTVSMQVEWTSLFLPLPFLVSTQSCSSSVAAWLLCSSLAPLLLATSVTVAYCSRCLISWQYAGRAAHAQAGPTKQAEQLPSAAALHSGPARGSGGSACRPRTCWQPCQSVAHDWQPKGFW